MHRSKRVVAITGVLVAAMIVGATAANAASTVYFAGSTAIHESKYTTPTTVAGGATLFGGGSGIASPRIYTKTSGFVPVYGATSTGLVASLTHAPLVNHRSMCSWTAGSYTTNTYRIDCARYY